MTPVRVALALVLLWATPLLAQQDERVLSAARKEKPAMIETMKDLVSIESGSRDREGSSASRR